MAKFIKLTNQDGRDVLVGLSQIIAFEARDWDGDDYKGSKTRVWATHWNIEVLEDPEQILKLIEDAK